VPHGGVGAEAPCRRASHTGGTQSQGHASGHTCAGACRCLCPRPRSLCATSRHRTRSACQDTTDHLHEATHTGGSVIVRGTRTLREMPAQTAREGRVGMYLHAAPAQYRRRTGCPPHPTKIQEAVIRCHCFALPYHPVSAAPSSADAPSATPFLGSSCKCSRTRNRSDAQRVGAH